MVRAGLDLSRLDVLVVDDNRHMLQIVRTILRSLEAERIRDMSDPLEALEEIRKLPPDVIIVDWAMEPIDGIEFTRRVRTDAAGMNPFVPIIMLTGHTEMRRVVAARDAGVTEFLAKPVTVTDIYLRLASVIEKPRAFIRSRDFFGPDRRRRSDEPYEGRERRASMLRQAAEEAREGGGRDDGAGSGKEPAAPEPDADDLLFE